MSDRRRPPRTPAPGMSPDSTPRKRKTKPPLQVDPEEDRRRSKALSRMVAEREQRVNERHEARQSDDLVYARLSGGEGVLYLGAVALRALGLDGPKCGEYLLLVGDRPAAGPWVLWFDDRPPGGEGPPSRRAQAIEVSPVDAAWWCDSAGSLEWYAPGPDGRLRAMPNHGDGLPWRALISSGRRPEALPPELRGTGRIEAWRQGEDLRAPLNQPSPHVRPADSEQPTTAPDAGAEGRDANSAPERPTDVGATPRGPSPPESPPKVALSDRLDEKVAYVAGKEKKLTTPQYDVVKALLAAGNDGLSKDALDQKGKHGDARKILSRLRESDPDWAKVIVMPGRPHSGGYRIKTS